jgi:hypothetical protein
MSIYEQVYVTGHDLQRHNRPAAPAGVRADQFLTPAPGSASQHLAAVPRAPHGAIPQVADAACGNMHMPGHAGDYTHRHCQASRFPRRPQAAFPSRGA